MKSCKHMKTCIRKKTTWHNTDPPPPSHRVRIILSNLSKLDTIASHCTNQDTTLKSQLAYFNPMVFLKSTFLLVQSQVLLAELPFSFEQIPQPNAPGISYRGSSDPNDPTGAEKAAAEKRYEAPSTTGGEAMAVPPWSSWHFPWICLSTNQP